MTTSTTTFAWIQGQEGEATHIRRVPSLYVSLQLVLVGCGEGAARLTAAHLLLAVLERLVPLEPVLGGGRVVALRANVGVLARVCPHVHVQHALVPEELPCIGGWYRKHNKYISNYKNNYLFKSYSHDVYSYKMSRYIARIGIKFE